MPKTGRRTRRDQVKNKTRTRSDGISNPGREDQRTANDGGKENTQNTHPKGIQDCPECDGRVVSDDSHGEHVCDSCGLVIGSDEIDRGPEWYASTPQEHEEKSRVGSPTTQMMHDKGLSTKIGWQNKDAYGNKLSEKRRQQMSRLRERDEWYRVRGSNDRTLRQGFSEIQRMGAALGVDKDVQEMASVVNRRATEENLLVGRSIEAVATASIYIACRQAGLPRTHDDVAATSRIEKRDFEMAYGSLVTELGLEVEATAAESYVPPFASEIGFEDPGKVEAVAKELLEAGRDENLHSGRSPSGLAGAAIYGAALTVGEEIIQPTVAETADTTCVTIRSHYRDLLRAADRPVPDVE